MNQVEQNLTCKNGKSVISSSKMLDIILSAYHNSRQINPEKDHKTYLTNNQGILENKQIDKSQVKSIDEDKESKKSYFKQL